MWYVHLCVPEWDCSLVADSLPVPLVPTVASTAGFRPMSFLGPLGSLPQDTGPPLTGRTSLSPFAPLSPFEAPPYLPLLAYPLFCHGFVHICTAIARELPLAV